MNVLIVSPCVTLPVPAVHGGAVSTLIEYLIKENEFEKKMKLTILSIYDVDAQKKSEEYPYTKFEFIHPIEALNQCDVVIDSVLAFGKKEKNRHQYLRKQHSLKCISRYMKNHDFDKVVFQNSGYLLNVLKDHAIAEKYKGKLYYHLHNDIPDNISVDAVGQCKLLLISEYLKKHINEVCGRDMDNQCMIVKNGFNCAHFAQELQEREKLALRQTLGIAPEKKIVMFAGRIVAAKGIVELTQAIKKLGRDDVVLMVVGAHNFGTGQTSNFQEEMKLHFKALGEKVCFTGYVPYDEIWKYYRLADVAVLPSIWEEPAGLTMIEACAAGVPLITTRSGGIPEYVKSDDSILLARNENIIDNMKKAINEVLNNPVLWKEKAKEAQKYVSENFETAKFYNDFYEKLMRS
ncbi:MAG: glycosyltransferase family 4 protein [Lachnospiraceae bacterium]|nr:glycosyltransferase family 4 protein [Lachnospiraceae bacterium]